MKRAFGVLVVALAVVVGTTVVPSAAADARIVATLTGAAERPGPGDPDAIGRAYITIDDETNTLCLALQYANVDGTLSGLHIHFAPPTDPGPVVVPFSVPSQQGSGVHYQCVVVENEALLDNIAANPSQYYINLHSQPLFGPGAIRGQLQGI
ncbi:MAG TPA: CHRD domain-containing protein [Acidimicrobiales bacterium]